ncbi:unnamed protein product [Ixodes pacificus]
MHRILAGIAKSDHPEDVKQNLIEKKLIPAASQPMAPGDCESLLEVSWNLATTGETEFLQNGGISVSSFFWWMESAIRCYARLHTDVNSECKCKAWLEVHIFLFNAK